MGKIPRQESNLKYLLYSDVHSNLPAFSVLAELARRDYPSASPVCLGDVVGYGADPSGCIRLLRELGGICIAGNHERMLLSPVLRNNANPAARKAIAWTQAALSASDLEFLAALPLESEAAPGFLAVHGSVRDPDEYITNRFDAQACSQILARKGMWLCAFGHTHFPGLWNALGTHFYAAEQSFLLSGKGPWLINPGSVGQPRDHDPRGSFCVLDTETMTVEFRRFDYDIGRAAQRIRDAGLPDILADRLFGGW